MISAKETFPAGEHLLVDGDRRAGPACILVSVREIAPITEGVGMLAAEYSAACVDDPLLQRDRLARASYGPVGGREIIADVKGLDMLTAEDLPSLSEQRLAYGDRRGGAVTKVVHQGQRPHPELKEPAASVVGVRAGREGKVLMQREDLLDQCPG